MELTQIALFHHYHEARIAIKRLAGCGFDLQAVSVLVRPDLRMQAGYRDSERVDRGAISGGTLDDLDAILLGRHPIQLASVGGALASGPMARALRTPGVTLSMMLMNAAFTPRQVERAYDGMRNGHVLVALHDELRDPDLIDGLWHDLGVATFEHG